ncbi:MAG: hypothetical protein COZ16_02710 [Flavobacteriaceae bacterium CG_4_10_14_3_um_filter_31_253]|nr:MAG: hypothetical protein COW43_05340 [Flavobacteriaceae bacterium CG17_big_fil_post_rev_8_21_14_2_50_31_13]PIX11616.1 MAG: hypothetical protein COZ74_13610 [Flavobacteriaceae bacterium CG_4_8_14_3_um_filter_31_8]PIY15801.1 MAG: hypothetical protein COZ16_02710 [Flavobacteriaceae bacterium CG_4_10_14_3_um_filter_31_253]PIZ10511.1 MAG: hypothetical protein COY55_08285 [Flavobacteriaceae bacterium CG_4_10_14_0_8_um_filter_31_99]PJC08718.1 MAG: hypothetical protein CO067_13525 [Flavobacteriacea
MNYNIFRTGLVGDFLDRLNQGDTSFIKLYENQEKFLYDFEETDILESNIKVLNENLGEDLLNALNKYKDDQQVADFECAKILYEYLKLTPAQAGNADFWNYLHHFDIYKYIHKRWKNQGNIQTHIKRHWLMNLTSQKYLINFPLTTLWWSIHITVDESREDKYELSKVYFSNNRFRTVSLGGMSFVRHKEAIISVLEFMRNYRNELTKNSTYTDIGDEISKFINLLGGTKPLSFFDRDWFTHKLKERFKIGKENKDSIPDFNEIKGEIELKEKQKVLCYFCLNNSGNPNYMISDLKRDDFDYCIEINGTNKDGFLIHFYAEGKIKKTKIDSTLLGRTRNQMYSNGKCNNLNLVGLKIITTDFLFGITYSKNGVTKFKAMDGSDETLFRIDNSSLNQEGKKILYVKDYEEIKYKLLTYSIKNDLGKLVQGPLGKGASVNNNYHSDKWVILEKFWTELFKTEQNKLNFAE